MSCCFLNGNDECPGGGVRHRCRCLSSGPRPATPGPAQVCTTLQQGLPALLGPAGAWAHVRTLDGAAATLPSDAVCAEGMLGGLAATRGPRGPWAGTGSCWKLGTPFRPDAGLLCTAPPRPGFPQSRRDRPWPAQAQAWETPSMKDRMRDARL